METRKNGVAKIYSFRKSGKRHHYIEVLSLTLLRMGGEQRVPPTSFSPVTSTNVRISPKNFLTFSFNPFATQV